MMRWIQILNFLGIAALATLCALEWRVDSRLNLRVISLEADQLEQASELGEKEKIIKGYVADMEDFRARLSSTQAELEKAHAQAEGAEALRTRTASQLEQSKVSLDKWVAAVAARDEALKQAEQQLEQRSKDRNDAILKFNELAGRYKAAVDQIKEANELIRKTAGERNDAVVKFNDLAARYNAMVKQFSTAATKPG